MNRLLINAINNRYKGNLFENLTNYNDDEMPVNVGDPGWELKSDNEKNFLFRSYTIDDVKLLRYFVGEVLLLANKLNHHPDINIYNNVIDIKLYTMNINDVSHLDVELSKKIDEIINDLTYLTSERD